MGKVYHLAFSQNPAPLFGSPYALFFLQAYTIVENDRIPGELKVKTLSYEYNVERKKDHQEIICFHWEGENARNPIPHLHIGSTVFAEHAPPFTNKAHVPTGRVCVEDIVTFLIHELRVQPTRNHRHDWASVVARTRALFYRFKQW